MSFLMIERMNVILARLNQNKGLSCTENFDRIELCQHQTLLLPPPHITWNPKTSVRKWSYKSLFIKHRFIHPWHWYLIVKIKWTHRKIEKKKLEKKLRASIRFHKQEKRRKDGIVMSRKWIGCHVQNLCFI